MAIEIAATTTRSRPAGTLNLAIRNRSNDYTKSAYADSPTHSLADVGRLRVLVDAVSTAVDYSLKGRAMRAPYTQLYLHCVWATWDRLPLISSAIEGQLYAAIVAKLHELKCDLIAIGGDVDHVHLLVRLPTTLAVATLLKEVKGSTSHLMTHAVTPNEFFKWQGAYGAFTVSKKEAKGVAAYIHNQKAHHAAKELVADWEQCETEDTESESGD